MKQVMFFLMYRVYRMRACLLGTAIGIALIGIATAQHS
jgi:hypothetical protein